MIEANEYYITKTAEEVGIEDKKIKKLIERFEGWRIYIRKKRGEYERIRDMYKQMTNMGLKRAEAVKRLSSLYEKSESRIRVITAERKGLFDE